MLNENANKKLVARQLEEQQIMLRRSLELGNSGGSLLTVAEESSGGSGSGGGGEGVGAARPAAAAVRGEATALDAERLGSLETRFARMESKAEEALALQRDLLESFAKLSEKLDGALLQQHPLESPPA